MHFKDRGFPGRVYMNTGKGGNDTSTFSGPNTRTDHHLH